MGGIRPPPGGGVNELLRVRKMMERLLSPRQLADVLNVKPGTVYSWLSRGVDLPAFVKIGGSTRWREAVVKEWIERNERERKRRNFEG